MNLFAQGDELLGRASSRNPLKEFLLEKWFHEFQPPRKRFSGKLFCSVLLEFLFRIGEGGDSLRSARSAKACSRQEPRSLRTWTLVWYDAGVHRSASATTPNGIELFYLHVFCVCENCCPFVIHKILVLLFPTNKTRPVLKCLAFSKRVLPNKRPPARSPSLFASSPIHLRNVCVFFETTHTVSP